MGFAHPCRHEMHALLAGKLRFNGVWYRNAIQYIESEEQADGAALHREILRTSASFPENCSAHILAYRLRIYTRDLESPTDPSSICKCNLSPAPASSPAPHLPEQAVRVLKTIPVHQARGGILAVGARVIHNRDPSMGLAVGERATTPIKVSNAKAKLFA